MPEDTTDRSTTRPNVPEELDERLAAVTTEHVRIPADRLTFADRLRVLIEEYEHRGSEIERLKEEKSEQERAVAQRDERIRNLEEQLKEANQGLVR